MKFFKKSIKQLPVDLQVDEKEIIKFYQQLVKMKKNRPHINLVNLLKRRYPNHSKFIDDLVDKESNVH